MGQKCGCLHAPKDRQMNLVANSSDSNSNPHLDNFPNTLPKPRLLLNASSRNSVSIQSSDSGCDSVSASTPPDHLQAPRRQVMTLPSTIDIHLKPFRSASDVHISRNHHSSARKPKLSKLPLDSIDQSGKLVSRKTRNAARLTPLNDVAENEVQSPSWNHLNTPFAGNTEQQAVFRWNNDFRYSGSFHFSGVDNEDCMMEDGDRDYMDMDMPVPAELLDIHEKTVFGFVRTESEKYGERLRVPSCIVQLCLMHYFAATPIRRKRVIFTSIVQLNLCIDRVPNYVLDESLFFFKATHRKELLSMLQQDGKKGSVHVHHLDVDASDEEAALQERRSLSHLRDIRPKFKQYLQKKHDENMLLVLDNRTSWLDISKQLAAIPDIWYDALNEYDRRRKHYKPLLLDESYWRTVHKEKETKYNAQIGEIVDEIHSASLKYAPSMEILWQSNPSLIPMKIFNQQQYHTHNGLNTEYLRCGGFMSRDTMMSPMAMAMGSGSGSNSSTQTPIGASHCIENTPTQGGHGRAHMHPFMLTPASNADLVILSVYQDGNDGINDSVGNSDATSYYLHDESSTSMNMIDMNIINDAQLFSNLQLTVGHRTPGHGAYAQRNHAALPSSALVKGSSDTDITVSSTSKCNLCHQHQ